MKNSLEKILLSSSFSTIPEEKEALDKSLALKERKKIDVNLFQGYDIRGDAIEAKPRARVNLKPTDAYLIGLSIGSDFIEKASPKKSALYRPKVFVAADNRPSSPGLREALVEGFLMLAVVWNIQKNRSQQVLSAGKS